MDLFAQRRRRGRDCHLRGRGRKATGSRGLATTAALTTLTLCATALYTTSCISVNRPDRDTSQSIAKRTSSLRGDGPRKRILLLPIINESVEKDPVVARTGREALLTGLRLTDNFILLEPQDLPGDVSQLKKDNGYDLDEVARVAYKAGILAILEGRVVEVKIRRSGDDVGLIRKMHAEVQSTVGVRVVSTNNHKEILNEARSATGEGKSFLLPESSSGGLRAPAAVSPDLIRQSLINGFQGTILSITKAVDKLSWKGKIAWTDQDRIYVNAGQITGINVGDLLRVTEEGTDVYDPETGLFIGRAPGRMKGTLEVVSYFGKDGCIAIVHSGSGFKEEDLVDLY
jgi:hypothetical protein